MARSRGAAIPPAIPTPLGGLGAILVALTLAVSLVGAGDAQPLLPSATTPASSSSSPDSAALPALVAFPGFWFDYLPDVVSSETGWEVKFRVGLPAATAVTAEFLDATNAVLGLTRLPVVWAAEDRAAGQLPVLSLPIPADPKIRKIRIRAQIPGAEPVQVLVELRDSTADCRDLRLAALPPTAKVGSAEHLQAAAQGALPALPAGQAWAALGARLATAEGNPVVIRHTPRMVAEDRSGVVTRIFQSPATVPADAPPRVWLVVAPAALKGSLIAGRTWQAVVAPAIQEMGRPALALPAPTRPVPLRDSREQEEPGPSEGTSLRIANASKLEPVLFLAPDASERQPFHPIAGCLATALLAMDQEQCDNLVILLPWEDALLGTDPREFSLAVDAMAEHFRVRQRLGGQPLRSLVLLGPFRHPSVPEKRHTMMESKVTERQKAQGFQWPDTPALSDPARWRLNPEGDALAVFGPTLNVQGQERLLELLRGIVP